MLRSWVGIVLATVVVGLARQAQAECVAIGDPIKYAFQSPDGGQIFLADVTSVTYVESSEIVNGRAVLHGYFRTTFRVVERFKGRNVAEPSIDFDLTAGNFLFKSGQRVLVFASASSFGGGWHTDCSQTHESRPGDPVVAVLRSLRDGR